MNQLKFKELLNLTIKNIYRRKLRSILTILSVTIGIAAVISLILISNGLFNAIEKQFDSMGVNSIFVMSSSFGGGMAEGDMKPPVQSGGGTLSSRTGSDLSLTINDLKTIEKIPEIEEAFAFTYKVLKVKYKNQDNFVNVLAVDEKNADNALKGMSLEIREGTSIQGKKGHNVVVGAYFADKLFDKPIKVGNTILIKNTEFKVTGILKPVGIAQRDSQIFINRDNAIELFEVDSKKVDQILAKAKNSEEVLEVKEKINKRLKKTHDKDSFTIITSLQILKMIKSILNTIKVILISIATISIIVGSIGIMNSIYTSVLERTKEIGILKSIGAKREDIYFIFVIESVILSLVGGIIGLGFGILISKAVEWYTIYKDLGILSVEINIGIVLLAIGLAVIIGFLAGLLPAKRASKLNTVNALKGN